MCKNICYIILLICFITGCDSDKYFSFNYEADRVSRIATVSGRVLNIFTGEEVDSAIVQIGTQRTTTDENGRYTMDYLLTDDDALSRPAPITISRSNYFDFDTSQIFFPEAVTLNFEMEYAAPIIERSVFYNLEICQAIILDYQGVDNVDTVIARVTYLNAQNQAMHQNVGLSRVDVVSENISYYQSYVPMQTPFGTIDANYTLTVIDKDGFSDFERRKNDVRGTPDPLLFDPGN